MSTDADSLPQDAAALRELCLQLQASLAQHHAVIAQQTATVQQQEQKIAQLEHRLHKLLARTFGKQSEKLDPDQLLLFDQEELAALSAELAAEVAEREAAANEAAPSVAESSEQNTPAKRKGHGRRELPAHLPREQKRYELPPEERICPCCGEQRAEIGSETSEQLEYIPASYKVIEHVRVKYACRHCEEHVALAPKPPQPVEKGLPGPGLLAQTVLAKYGDHAPLYRLEDIALASIFDLDGLGWLFVRELVEQALNLLEDGVEFPGLCLVLAVIGLGGDVAAKVIQVVKGHHHRLVSWRFSDDLLNLLGPGTSVPRQASSRRPSA